ncbi:hypothetical protein LCGC14_0225860 [marine sediment metagenome]|uniref:Uncharacterized protein n=1 Tax=marine sediment metagenome TaxID=412755 RepID=A0A0F9XFN9_9ZZZZ
MKATCLWVLFALMAALSVGCEPESGEVVIDSMIDPAPAAE